MLCLLIIIKYGVYLQDCFAAFIWGVKNVLEGLLKFSRFIYCGPGVFILKVEKMAHKTHLSRLSLEGKGVVYPVYGWFWKL